MKLCSTIFSFFVLITIANAQVDCNSWGKFQNRLDAFAVGDLDVTGNKVTIEASFNMTSPSVDIISKHRGSNDLNYLLRPTRAEISTDGSGFVVTNEGSSSCNDISEVNKTYHATLVYDGSTLKFYRNGALISQVPA